MLCEFLNPHIHYAPVKAARVPGAFAAVSLTHKNPWPLPAGNRVFSQAGATSSPNYHHEREQAKATIIARAAQIGWPQTSRSASAAVKHGVGSKEVRLSAG